MKRYSIEARMILPLGVALLVALIPAQLQAQEEVEITVQEVNIDTFVELLRDDIRTQRAAIVSAMMQLTPEQAEAFWPVYEAYSKELSALGDQRLALIKHYAEEYSTLTDDQADSLVTRGLGIEAARTNLKRKYFERISEALSPKIAARYIQIDNQLLMILNLQIASNLPLAQ